MPRQTHRLLLLCYDHIGNYQFEEAALEHTSCDVHTFDCTWDGKSILEGRHFYHKLCLGLGQDSTYRSWQNITHSLGHSRVDLLKMDIGVFGHAGFI